MAYVRRSGDHSRQAKVRRPADSPQRVKNPGEPRSFDGGRPGASGDLGRAGQIQITDLYGRQVRQMIIVPGAVEIKIPADYLPDGMYFFRIRLDDLETTRKVIIQH